MNGGLLQEKAADRTVAKKLSHSIARFMAAATTQGHAAEGSQLHVRHLTDDSMDTVEAVRSSVLVLLHLQV